MNKILYSFAAVLALLGAEARAQQTYNLFRPANGILVGQTNTYVTTAAAASNVISLWSGTCNATTFLRGDGSCQIVTTVSPANPTGTIGLTANNGALATYARSDATPALSQAIVPTWTGLHTWSASVPSLRLFATGAATDRKDVRVEATGAGQFQLNAYNDAGTFMNSLIVASRASGGFTTSTFGHNNGAVTLQGGTSLNFISNNVTRLGITSAGEWQLAGAGGSAGNVITSAGAGAPPTWQSVTPAPIVCTTACNASGLAVGQTAYIVKGTTTSRDTTITLADDPDMSFTVVSGRSYEVQNCILISFPVATTGGFRWAWIGATGTQGAVQYANGGPTSSARGILDAASQSISSGLGIDPDQNFVCGQGFIVTTSTTYVLRWAQNTSNANAVRLLANSTYARITRIL